MNWIQKIVAKVGIDKVAHFAVSAFLCLALGRLVHWAIAAGVVLALGVAKELYDIPKTGFDKKDLIADLFGILTGVLAAALTMMI